MSYFNSYKNLMNKINSVENAKKLHILLISLYSGISIATLYNYNKNNENKIRLDNLEKKIK